MWPVRKFCYCQQIHLRGLKDTHKCILHKLPPHHLRFPTLGNYCSPHTSSYAQWIYTSYLVIQILSANNYVVCTGLQTLCCTHYVSRNSGNTYSNNLGILRHTLFLALCWVHTTQLHTMPTMQEHEFPDCAPKCMTYCTYQRYTGLHYMLMSLQITLQPE
jgi:hypothetical protein